jgi:hypothetical protein
LLKDCYTEELYRKEFSNFDWYMVMYMSKYEMNFRQTLSKALSFEQTVLTGCPSHLANFGREKFQLPVNQDNRIVIEYKSARPPRSARLGGGMRSHFCQG